MYVKQFLWIVMHLYMRVYTVAMCACACVSVWHILHHVHITHVYIVAF